MASEGLLGFIGGVAEGMVEEIDRQKELRQEIAKEERTEGRAIAAEGRAEERAIRAEKRKIAAEKARDRWLHNFKMSKYPEEERLKAETAQGLLAAGINPELEAQKQEDAYQLRQIQEGKDVTSAREEYQDVSEGQLIDAGLDSATKRKRKDLELTREDERIRREEGLYTKDSPKKSEIKFSVSEATKQLSNDLANIHDINLSAVRKHKEDEGSRLTGIENGEEDLPDILTDSYARGQLRGEIALKLHAATERRLKQAAKAGDIQSLDQVTELSNQIAQRTDMTLAALERSLQDAQKTGNYEQISQQLHEALRQGWGEPEDPEKQSVAFRQVWKALKRTYERANNQ